MRAARILIGCLVLVAILAGGAYLLRLPLAGMAVRAGMSAAGLGNPRARVTALSLDRIALADVAAGSQGRDILHIDAAEAAYDWRALLFERRARTVRAGPGFLHLAVSPDGEISIPGVGGARGGEGGGALPFSALELNNIALAVDTPEGAARGAVSATYDVKSGGAAQLQIETDRAGLENLIFENAALGIDATFAGDGAVSADGSLSGDIVSSYGSLDGVDLAVEGEGRSWKDIAEGNRDAFTGRVRIDLNAATAPVADVPALARLGEDRAALIFGAPVSSLDALGTLVLTLDEAGFSAAPEGPVRLRADSGAVLEIEAEEDAPLYRRADGKSETAFAYAVSGALVSVAGAIDAETTDEGWFIHAPLRIGEYRSDAVSIDESSAVLRITTQPNSLSADVTTSSRLREASIGRFAISDAPLSAHVLIDADMDAGRATASLPDDSCISLERGRFRLEEPDMKASLKAARLCGDGGPLATIQWNDNLRADFSGVLTAADASYAMGETQFAGHPPRIGFRGSHEAAAGRTQAAGTIAGGAVRLNDALVFSAADGRFDLALGKEALNASARFDSVRVAQNAAAPLVAPVIASGEARLSGQDARFSYRLKTPSGAALGAGQGVHDMAAAQGRTTFAFERIMFKPGGVQPEGLAPGLKGVIGETIGAAEGSGEFAWDSSGLSSSADFSFEDITFAGPTRVVTQTAGLNGKLGFTSLWPPETNGVQTISVNRIDLDNLQLGAGDVKFELPGDEILRVEQAEFPWMGGVLGVYDAVMSIAGGRSVAPMRVQNIDLGQFLAAYDVDGLSGEGLLSGSLPLVIEEGHARIDGGVLKSVGPGAVRYAGGAASEAAAQGGQAQVAFDLLRDLRYESAEVRVDGPLAGRLQFAISLEGTGVITRENQNVRVPVKYNISLDAPLLELLNQAALTTNFDLQLQRALEGRSEE